MVSVSERFAPGRFALSRAVMGGAKTSAKVLCASRPSAELGWNAGQVSGLRVLLCGLYSGISRIG